ncbi:hypothetical protein LA080_015053 [Diaporthe eres]|nr:hypothetical protein LA080_015053 [Diaporthe eres]
MPVAPSGQSRSLLPDELSGLTIICNPAETTTSRRDNGDRDGSSNNSGSGSGISISISISSNVWLSNRDNDSHASPMPATSGHPVGGTELQPQPNKYDFAETFCAARPVSYPLQGAGERRDRGTTVDGAKKTGEGGGDFPWARAAVHSLELPMCWPPLQTTWARRLRPDGQDPTRAIDGRWIPQRLAVEWLIPACAVDERAPGRRPPPSAPPGGTDVAIGSLG